MTSFYATVDIVFEILSRLPVKSLLRFKTVCKTWYVMIKSPRFIETHQTRCTSGHVVVNSYCRIRKSTCSSFRCGEASSNNFNFDLLDFRFASHNCEVVAICDGLVCVRDNGRELIICNPAIRQYWRTPPFKVAVIPDACFHSYGFARHAGCYKLVRIVKTGKVQNNSYVTKGELYTTSTKTWKEFLIVKGGALANHQRYYIHPYGTYVNGVIYWQANLVFGPAVALFNLCNGVLDVMEAPSSVKPSSWLSNCQLRKIKEELALIVSLDDRALELWVLNESNRTWTRRHTIINIPRFQCRGRDYGNVVSMLGYTKHDELILKDLYEVVSYNLGSEETKVIHDIFLMNITQAYNYDESLVCFDGVNGHSI